MNFEWHETKQKITPYSCFLPQTYSLVHTHTHTSSTCHCTAQNRQSDFLNMTIEKKKNEWLFFLPCERNVSERERVRQGQGQRQMRVRERVWACELERPEPKNSYDILHYISVCFFFFSFLKGNNGPKHKSSCMYSNNGNGNGKYYDKHACNGFLLVETLVVHESKSKILHTHTRTLVDSYKHFAYTYIEYICVRLCCVMSASERTRKYQYHRRHYSNYGCLNVYRKCLFVAATKPKPNRTKFDMMMLIAR